MSIPFDHYRESADALRRKTGDFIPRVLLILGSGLGALADQIQTSVRVPFSASPHAPVSTAPGHTGALVFGVLEGVPVVAMQGRVHAYEGYSMEQVCYLLRVVRLLGAETLVVTNAAGCINIGWEPGDIMLISDHIKLCGESPLSGENLPQFGPRFPDCTSLYTPRLRALARSVAAEQGLTLREGVYMYFLGPQYETPAEIRAARTLGADAAGMSTAPEVIAAGHCGMEVLGFTFLTNMAAGVTGERLDEQEVIRAAEAGKTRFTALVRGCLRSL